MGHEVVALENGALAIEYIKNNHADLLVTDIHMPEAGGLELVNYLRNSLNKNIPIIMLSREGDEDIVMKAFELGADDYITKPYNPDELRLRIKKLVIRLKK
jgi:DNA-binding response OmpR family regulator